jgi:hypothetical protein
MRRPTAFDPPPVGDPFAAGYPATKPAPARYTVISQPQDGPAGHLRGKYPRGHRHDWAFPRGFAGIVGALAGEKLRPADPGLWLPFWVMISGGLSLVFAALFRVLAYYVGARDHVLWAASSAIVTVLTACSLAFFVPRFLRARRGGFLAGLLAFDFFWPERNQAAVQGGHDAIPYP